MKIYKTLKKRIYGIILSISIISGTQVLAENTGFGFSAQGFGYADEIEVIGSDHNDAVGSEARLIKTIRNAVNRVLGILGLIALILCLWGGFQILTANGDDSKVKTGTKVLKNAAIGLIVIGISWLVVTFVFRIINTVAAETQ